ncbi:S-adenosyl-L-methionine-dependent methyltransferase [Macroventuria anomochaeta]|uniref:S-adenosyl-L-methionine-dependent methyltransferase n=1 Tax=Macroventuria anomochaeta TaxID=301207 RepID=A0ACB6S844_9PLEO|nr:S-adenosyl-L-methionine-dependent methyltransferase [Macroventuria anomochaeta]KAF2630133.1 S-adenosyl-L-methionine-dependent methyltransferase [Macroventuria anomochaeta]
MIRIRPSLPRLSTHLKRTGKAWFANSASGRVSKGTRDGVPMHWNKETLATSDKYPLSQELFDKVHPNTEEPHRRMIKGHTREKRKTATSHHARTQIVSPDLCDDVLKYYGKSLEIHKGCDILDINPGAGLWSQKLHAFLQPRSHVLMEPSPDRFKTFLDPLLNAPGSKYKLVQKDTIELEQYTEMINEGVFPDQTRVNPEDDSGQELNTTLLVTGTLVWDPKLPGMAFDSMAKQLYNLFSSAVRSNDYFHAYGRVRTIFWVSADDFKPIIADSIANFAKNNCLLEMTQSMDLIVNAPRGERGRGKAAPGREPQYEIESSVRAMQRARESGMSLPTHREDKIHQIAAEIEELSNGTGRSKGSWLHDYLQAKHREGKTPIGLLSDAQFQHQDHAIALQKKYPDLNFEAMGNAVDPKVKRKGTFWKGKEDHPGREEAHAFMLTKAADRARIAKKEHMEHIADIGEELYHAECRALRMPDGPERGDLLKQITDLDKQWEKLMSAVAANYKASPIAILDDRISLRFPPHSRLQWDRRPFEPLTMTPDEAWPPNRLALISSTPFPRPAGQTVDWHEWVHDFVYALFTVPSRPLPEALDKMQHGASQIIESCPSLTDPDKGGRMNMKHLRVRVLTAEMIEELVRAYRDWPFKEPGSDHNKYFRWKGLNRGNDYGAS